MTKALEAARLAVEDRHQHYGSPLQNFEDIARLWTVALRPLLKRGAQLSPLHVAQLNRLQKEARLIKSPSHQDSLTDIIGYVICHEEVVEEFRRHQSKPQEESGSVNITSRPVSEFDPSKFWSAEIAQLGAVGVTSEPQSDKTTEPDRTQDPLSR